MEKTKESSFGFSWADEVEREEEQEKENQIRIQREIKIARGGEREMEKTKESSFGFSWADEVEREEEQEKENQIRIQREREIAKNNKRSDPFGAARPREVILEENGVDWKNLEQDFSFRSSIREGNTKAVTKKKPLEIQKSRNTLPSRQTVPCEEFVPPLKYPPKNIESVFEEIYRARKLKPNNTMPNFKPNNQCVENRVLVNSNAKRDSMICTNQNTLSNLNKVASGYVPKEKMGSNFEPKSVKENGTKEEDKPVQRRVLVEINNATCKKTTCKKTTCSNNYFGVLELSEPPSSQKKSNSRKWSCEEFEDNLEDKFEVRKKNGETPTISKIIKGNKRSKK